VTRRLAALLVAASVLPSCERKAPGPRECEQFALQALGVPEDARLLPPRIADAVDELTVKCLVTPYDRELVRCVDEGNEVRRCLLEYQSRVETRELASTDR